MITSIPAEATGGSAWDMPSNGFKVYTTEGAVSPAPVQGRRDFYKIVLVTGEMTICTGAQTIEANGTFLFLANPQVPHSVVDRSEGENDTLVYSPKLFSRAGDERNSCAIRPWFAWAARP